MIDCMKKENEKNTDYIIRIKLKEKADKNWSCKEYNIFFNFIILVINKIIFVYLFVCFFFFDNI